MLLNKSHSLIAPKDKTNVTAQAALLLRSGGVVWRLRRYAIPPYPLTRWVVTN